MVSAKFAHTTKHGAIKGKTQTKNVEFYALDVILSVGYRTNSSKAVEFRKWSNKVLKDHLIKGYTINRKHIAKNYDAFMKAVADVQSLLPEHVTLNLKLVWELIREFASTWVALDAYDKDKFSAVGSTKKSVKIFAGELLAGVNGRRLL